MNKLNNASDFVKCEIVITPEERALMETTRHPNMVGSNASLAQFHVWMKQSSGRTMSGRHYRPETKEIIYFIP